jgi:hypothetical protein
MRAVNVHNQALSNCALDGSMWSALRFASLIPRKGKLVPNTWEVYGSHNKYGCSREEERIVFSCRILNIDFFIVKVVVLNGPDSGVGIATSYGLDGPGIESRWVEIFRTCPDRPWGPPSLLYNVHRVFPGVKERPRRDADPSPTSSAVVMKG